MTAENNLLVLLLQYGIFDERMWRVDERNTTYRAKERYFQIFPRKGFQNLLPKEIFIRNINLDAISALIIAEDYLNFKFEVNDKIQTKTWLKQ